METNKLNDKDNAINEQFLRLRQQLHLALNKHDLEDETAFYASRAYDTATAMHTAFRESRGLSIESIYENENMGLFKDPGPLNQVDAVNAKFGRG